MCIRDRVNGQLVRQQDAASNITAIGLQEEPVQDELS